jgi:hypothetical protein
MESRPALSPQGSQARVRHHLRELEQSPVRARFETEPSLWAVASSDGTVSGSGIR